MADPGRPSGPPGSSGSGRGAPAKDEDSPRRSLPAPSQQGSGHPRPSTAQRESSDNLPSGSPSMPSGFPPNRPRAPSQASSSSGRGLMGGLPASSSYPELTRDSPSHRANFPPGRPRAPTVESLASGIGSLTTLPSSSSHEALPRDSPGRPAGSPASGSGLQPVRSRAPTLGSRASGSPSTPSRILPRSPSLGRGSPLVPDSNLARSPASGQGSPSNVSPSSVAGLSSRPRAPTTSSQASAPTGSPAQTSRILFKTFRVTTPISAADAESLNGRTQLNGFVELDVGDFGVVPNIPENVIGSGLSPYPRVQILRDAPGRPEPRPGMPLGNGMCRVPAANIETGVLLGNVQLVDEADFSNPTLKLQLSPNIPLQRFLESFLASMSQTDTQTQLKLHGVPGTAADIVSQPSKCRQFVKEFLNGMEYCQSLELFRNELPNLGKIWTELRHVNSEASNAPFTKDGTYFYILMYYNEKTGDIALYIGRTFNPLVRYSQHTKSLSGNEQLLHYQMARKRLREGATHRLFPIAFLPKNMPNANLFRSWGETILAVLFDSFNPVMLNIKQPSASNELSPDELAQLGKSLQQDAYLQTCGAPLAKLLQTVAGRIKNADSSLGGFKSKERFTGLNWSVPLAECVLKEANLWVRTTTHGDENKPAMWTFRTHPRRITKTKRIGVFYGDERDTQPAKFRPVIPMEGTSLEPGSVVNIVVEITIDPNDKHPYPYARMPTVGPFDCWNEASRLAVRIEFEDDQGWKTMYLKQDYVTIFSSKIKSMKASDLGDELNHIELGWVHAIKMLATLLNWRWRPEDNALARRVWVPYCSRLRIIDFDFFNQRLVVSDYQPVSKPIPRLLTLDETSNLIEEKFGYDVHIGSLPNLALMNTRGPAMRTKCDLCLMGSQGTQGLGLARKCKDRWVVNTVNGVNLFQCPFSAALGRYCTFTNNIENRPDLHDLVYLQGEKGYPVQNTVTPPNVFQYLEVREKLEEEPVEDDD